MIRYRNGVLNGKGASLLDGYMEDLATDRIYRLMIAQRLRHNGHVPVTDERERLWCIRRSWFPVCLTRSWRS